MRIYLCGGIENAPDAGSQWRENITGHLMEWEYKVINPLLLEISEREARGIDLERPEQYKFDDRIDDNFRYVMQQIVALDLEAVKVSDVLLVYADQYLSAGSYGEITVAALLKIPVILHIAPGYSLKNLPGWICGCVNYYVHDLDGLNRALLDIEGTKYRRDQSINKRFCFEEERICW